MTIMSKKLRVLVACEESQTFPSLSLFFFKMAITETQYYQYASTGTSTAASSNYSCTDYSGTFDGNYTLTYTQVPEYVYFEPKEIVDWRGLEVCFKGFKSRYKVGPKVQYNIHQPSRDYRNKRKMRIQKLSLFLLKI